VSLQGCICDNGNRNKTRTTDDTLRACTDQAAAAASETRENIAFQFVSSSTDTSSVARVADDRERLIGRRISKYYTGDAGCFEVLQQTRVK